MRAYKNEYNLVKSVMDIWNKQKRKSSSPVIVYKAPNSFIHILLKSYFHLPVVSEGQQTFKSG